MTFALDSHVVAQSDPPKRGVEEAELPTALLAETAPCAAPSSNRHQSQVAVHARRRQPAPASLHLSHRTLRSTCCCRVLRARRAPSPPSRPSWQTSSRCQSSSFSTISQRSDAPRAYIWVAAGHCETAWSFLAAAQVAGLVQQRGSCHQAAQARRLRVSGGIGGAVLVAFATSMLDEALHAKKSAVFRCIFLAL